MGYIINTLKKDELKGIIDLYLRNIQEQFMYKGDRFLYELLIDVKEKKIFIAKRRKQIIGCIYALKHLSGSGWLGGLFIDPVHRRKGIGINLVKCCLEYLKSRGCIDTFLFTDPNNLAAISLFEKLEFYLVYRRVRFYKKLDSEECCSPLVEGIKFADESDFEKLKNLILYSPEVKGRHNVILYYYYPVNLNEDMIRLLIKRDKVLTYIHKGEYEGVIIFQEVPKVIIGEGDFIIKDELASQTKRGKKGKYGEINIAIGSEKAILYILSEIFNILKKHKIKCVNYYSYIDDTHASTFEKVSFEQIKPINVMRYTFVGY